MKPSLGIIIQARMGSSRLPGKVLKPLGNWCLLEHIVRRCAQLPFTVQTVVATSSQRSNDPIVDWCHANSLACFRGDEHNVLERYVQCTASYDFDHIVRLTGDNPFPDMEELAKLIEGHITNQADFSYSYPVLPIGIGAEVFTREALDLSLLKASEPHHFEHVDEYLLEHLHNHIIYKLPPVPAKNYPDLRLTIDTEADYHLCSKLVQQVGELISTVEAIALCTL